jgi:DNA-binding MarR family transcriptional regulator
MLLLKELPDTKSLQKLLKRYPDADIKAISEFATLLRASSDLSDTLDNMLAQHNLYQGRWWVLVLLMRQDNHTSTPTDLAKKTGVTKATMTGFIDGLERDGLVCRMMDTEDRRKYLVQLTPSGQNKLDEVMPDYYTKVAALMSCLTESQRESMVKYINELADNSHRIR